MISKEGMEQYRKNEQARFDAVAAYRPTLEEWRKLFEKEPTT